MNVVLRMQFGTLFVPFYRWSRLTFRFANDYQFVTKSKRLAEVRAGDYVSTLE